MANVNAHIVPSHCHRSDPQVRRELRTTAERGKFFFSFFMKSLIAVIDAKYYMLKQEAGFYFGCQRCHLLFFFIVCASRDSFGNGKTGIAFGIFVLAGGRSREPLYLYMTSHEIASVATVGPTVIACVTRCD